jgi:hypothetical protein
MFDHHFREGKKKFGKKNTHEFRKKSLKQWVHLISYGGVFFFKSLKFLALKIALLTP